MRTGDNKQRTIYVVIIVTLAFVAGIMVTLLTLNRDKGRVSRFEWIQAISDETYISDYDSDDPFFSDVDNNDSYFSVVQAAVEADIIPITKRFKGDKPVTGEFAAITALRAVDEYKRIHSEETLHCKTDEDYLELAIEYGLIDKSETDKVLSDNRCKEILISLIELIQGDTESTKEDHDYKPVETSEEASDFDDSKEFPANELRDEEEFSFSTYAGTYIPTEWSNDAAGGGQNLNDLVLGDEGIITGGGSYYLTDMYPEKKPISVNKEDDGSYRCIVNKVEDNLEDVFYIYPVGVVEERFKDDERLVNSIYIRYVKYDGGVSELVYYRIDEADLNDSANIVDISDVKLDQHYTTKYGQVNSVTCPTFSFDYPSNWKIDFEEYDSIGGIIELVQLKDENGASITYMEHGNGSYGPMLKNGTIKEVASSSVIPSYPAGTDSDCSNLGEFVVAHAYESEAASLFGSYAVIPKSNLGDFEDIDNRLSFAYPDFEYMFVSSPPKSIDESAGVSESYAYSDQEIKEIVAILSTFRIED